MAEQKKQDTNQLLKVRREACRPAGKWKGPVSDHKI